MDLYIGYSPESHAFLLGYCNPSAQWGARLPHTAAMTACSRGSLPMVVARPGSASPCTSPGSGAGSPLTSWMCSFCAAQVRPMGRWSRLGWRGWRCKGSSHGCRQKEGAEGLKRGLAWKGNSPHLSFQPRKELESFPSFCGQAKGCSHIAWSILLCLTDTSF